MTTKLTLSMDDQVIESAKRYAKKKGESLSGIVENYLKSISNAKSVTTEISPRVRKLMGSIQLPKDFDYKKELKNAIGKKYSK
jgi:Family of unknown function (DUF6364)